MTMLSFRVEPSLAAAVDACADRLGVDRSQLLRDAVRLRVDQILGEDDADHWAAMPMDEGELALAAIADWGPAEDWSDWADAGDTSDDRG